MGEVSHCQTCKRQITRAAKLPISFFTNLINTAFQSIKEDKISCQNVYSQKLPLAFLLVSLAVAISGCASITSDPMTPIALSLSDGSSGECLLENKRGVWNASVPTNVSVRRSDDVLKYKCKTRDGREVSGAIQSRIGAKIVASAVFLDFGIVDSITDKHREYPTNFVIPIAKN